MSLDTASELAASPEIRHAERASAEVCLHPRRDDALTPAQEFMAARCEGCRRLYDLYAKERARADKLQRELDAWLCAHND